MPRTRQDLTAGEWTVLALLDERPTHGFAIARAMAPGGEVGCVWSMRRPLIYRALETLTSMGLARPVGIVASSCGPQRTVQEITPAGRRALRTWLRQPVAHIRDTRSLLMLKLLFLSRREADAASLLTAQLEQFGRLEARLNVAVDTAEDFERTLLLWRLQCTTAAIGFIETLLAEPVQARGAAQR